MGRRTWESLPHALPGRQNIVVSRQPQYRAEGALVASSLEHALREVGFPEPAFCIGGGELYRVALPLARTAFVTEIERPFEGDATFPELDPRDWTEMQREPRVDAAAGFAYAFVTYRRLGTPRDCAGPT